MGLPGSGKTYLAKRMQPILRAAWYNADIEEKWQMIGIFHLKEELGKAYE